MKVWVEREGEEIFRIDGSPNKVSGELARFLLSHPEVSGAGVASWLALVVKGMSATVYHGMTTSWDFRVSTGEMFNASY